MLGTIVYVVAFLIIALSAAYFNTGFLATLAIAAAFLAVAFLVINFLEKREKKLKLDENFVGFSSEALELKDSYNSLFGRAISKFTLEKVKSRKIVGPFVAKRKDVDAAVRQVLRQVVKELDKDSDPDLDSDPPDPDLLEILSDLLTKESTHRKTP